MKIEGLAFGLLMGVSLSLYSQESNTLLFRADPILAELDSILNSPDSLSILSLIDGILQLPEERSQIAVRVGYNSNVTSSGRTLNINKFGLSPGASFYHKSGAYADVATYWSQEYNPELYLTMGSLGYVGFIGKYWSLMGEYSHYFYTPYKDASTRSDSLYAPTPYTNNLYLSNTIEVGKWLQFRLDYSLLFGKQTAHRVSPVAGINLTKRHWLGFDRVSFFPTVSVLFGSETVSEYLPNWTRPLGYILLLRTGKPLYREEKKQVFGLMNYGISVPVSLTLKKWNMLMSYTYNFPRSLPGENLSLTNSGYAAVSLTRYFTL